MNNAHKLQAVGGFVKEWQLFWVAVGWMVFPLQCSGGALNYQQTTVSRHPREFQWTEIHRPMEGNQIPRENQLINLHNQRVQKHWNSPHFIIKKRRLGGGDHAQCFCPPVGTVLRHLPDHLPQKRWWGWLRGLCFKIARPSWTNLMLYSGGHD